MMMYECVHHVHIRAIQLRTGRRAGLDDHLGEELRGPPLLPDHVQQVLYMWGVE